MHECERCFNYALLCKSCAEKDVKEKILEILDQIEQVVKTKSKEEVLKELDYIKIMEV